MLTLTELAELVKELRDSQKTFFRSHGQDQLERAKELERKVDAAVAEILDKQPTLF